MSLQSVSPDIAANVRHVTRQLAQAARDCGRDPADVSLVAVTKTQPANAIRAAMAAGCTDFGENYLQEAVPKIASLGDLPVTWHYIGAIQSNKTRPIAEHFHWVHTVSRLKIAERLSAQCPPGKTLNVTLQVNIDDDPAKAGTAPEEVADLLAAAAGLPNLRVRGLMTILQRESAPLASYRRLAELFEALLPVAPDTWDVLSMGMTGDFREAVAAGSTRVRIGTALFGERRSRH
jgi:pyridoxal phosphate enzyme (YggS family)